MVDGDGDMMGIETPTLTNVECAGTFTANPTAGSSAWATIGLSRTTLI
ncbi:hypothetical protein [Vulcanisaeta sp. EB80]|nr:hypothetical protein [Vulcanisaeta sp. EB80]